VSLTCSKQVDETPFEGDLDEAGRQPDRVDLEEVSGGIVGVDDSSFGRNQKRHDGRVLEHVRERVDRWNGGVHIVEPAAAIPDHGRSI
jgi:hypothetical protein